MNDKRFQDKEWLQEQYDKGKKGIEIAKLCGVSDSTVAYWAKKLDVKRHNLRTRASRKKYLNEHYFDVIDTEEKAYWLGFIMADGCITQTDKKYPANRFHFCLKKSDGEFEHLMKFLDAIEGQDYEVKEKKNKNKTLDFETIIYELRINSKLFVQSLVSNGVVMNKTGKELIPHTIPADLTRHFVRGFFDGDGSITKSKAVRLGSSSRLILEQINECFSDDDRFKIYTDLRYKIPFYYFDSQGRDRNQKFLDYLYKGATIYLERKYQRYLEY